MTQACLQGNWRMKTEIKWVVILYVIFSLMSEGRTLWINLNSFPIFQRIINNKVFLMRLDRQNNEKIFPLSENFDISFLSCAASLSWNPQIFLLPIISPMLRSCQEFLDVWDEGLFNYGSLTLQGHFVHSGFRSVV